MPYVSLDDDELREMVIDRPQIITAAIEGLIKDLEGEREHGWEVFNSLQGMRQGMQRLAELLIMDGGPTRAAIACVLQTRGFSGCTIEPTADGGLILKAQSHDGVWNVTPDGAMEKEPRP